MSTPTFTLLNDWHSQGRRHDLGGILVLYVCGIALTHLLHTAIQFLGWKSLPGSGLLVRLVFSTLLISSLWCLLYSRAVPINGLRGAPAIPFDFWSLSILIGRQIPGSGFFLFHVVFMSFVLGAWLLIYFTFVNLREKQRVEIETWKLKASLAGAELAALHAQTNPHFLYNALNGLRGLISEDPVRAQDAITRLARILRYTLQLNKTTLVSLEQELQAVDDYLDMEGLRFEDRLKISREIDPVTLSLLIPPMTVQTLVENAIKFGVSRHPGPNHLVISTRRKKALLEIEITNDGALDAISDSTAIGLRNATDRLRGLLGASSELRLTSPSSGRVSAMIITPGRSFSPAS